MVIAGLDALLYQFSEAVGKGAGRDVLIEGRSGPRP